MNTQITIIPVQEQHKKQIPQDLSKILFGSVFTDHIFVMDWTQPEGWHNARVQPFQNFECHPAMVSLHYGCEIFEGMKAYQTDKNEIVLFRPYENLKRMNNSAKRMCMPEIDIEFVLEGFKKLLNQDASWVPSAPGTSLYIRPTMIATETTLNLTISTSYRFYIICSPVGNFYPGGLKPAAIMVSEKYTRASVGGVGNVKTGGNYAASMLAQKEAKEQGFAQVMWLDPVERNYVEEVGAMNIFFVINNQVITPKLTGTILPGITRASVLELGKNAGLTMVERRISITEVITAIQDGSCTEVFGTGTAVVICPVGKLAYQGKTYEINNNQPGPIASYFYNELTAFQTGKTKDKFGWIEMVTNY